MPHDRQSQIGSRRRQRRGEEVRQEILAYLERTAAERGYPPSVREIAEEVHLASPASVQHHLRTLERDGLIRRDPTRSRAIALPVDRHAREAVRTIPLLADVGAGYTVLAGSDAPEEIAVPAALLGSGDHFALRVRGESMVDLGILEGDIAVVRRQEEADDGDIVVALLEEEYGTVKVLRREGSRAWLEARNHADERYRAPIELDARGAIQGRVVALLRLFAHPRQR